MPYGQHIYPIPLGSGMVPTYFCWAPFQAASVGSTVPGQRRSYPKFFKAQVVDERPGRSLCRRRGFEQRTQFQSAGLPPC